MAVASTSRGGAFSATSINGGPLGPGIRLSGTCVACDIAQVLDHPEYCLGGTSYCLITPRISPSLLGQAQFYQQYIFRSLRFRYVPSCPSTTAQSLRVAWFADDSIAYHAVPTYQALAEQAQSMTTLAWQPCTWNIPIVPRSRPVYYMDRHDTEDDRDVYQGLLIGRLSATPASNGPPLGWLEMDYVVDFYNRSINLSVSSQVEWAVSRFDMYPTTNHLEDLRRALNALQSRIHGTIQKRSSTIVESPPRDHQDAIPVEIRYIDSARLLQIMPVYSSIENPVHAVIDQPVEVKSLPQVEIKSMPEVKIESGHVTAFVSNDILTPVPVSVVAADSGRDWVQVPKGPPPPAVRRS